MKRLILGSLALLLISTTTAPAVRAQIIPLHTPSNPAANPVEDPGSSLAPGTPGVPSVSNGKTLLGTPRSNPTTNHCSWLAQRLLGTPSHAAANPAADPGSRLDTDSPGAPNVSGRHSTKNC